MPVGLVGSGKTSVLKPLAERLHLLRVSGDGIRRTIQDNDGDLENTWGIGNLVVARFAERGYSIAHDTDGATPKTQESIARQAEKYGVSVIWIHVNPPEDFILEKLKNYPHTWLFSDADEAIANYHARKPLHTDLPMDFTYTFDPSRPDLAEQIKDAVLAIHNALNTTPNTI